MQSQGASQIKQRVGANVRAVRDRLGLTQMQFAERLGTRPGDVSRWETGTILPSLKALAAIGEIAGCDVAWFYMDNSDDPDLQPAA